MVQPTRRRLLAGLALLGAGPALAQVQVQVQYHAPTRVYLVPLDDFSEYYAGELASQLQAALGIRIRSSMRLPPLDLPLLPGTEQYAGEELLMRAAGASAGLPGLLPSTYRVFLTARDINASAGGFRYQFSMHMPALNCSVVSMARLLDGADPSQPAGPAATRMLKMVKRAIGELHLGWRRSTDRHDLMYAPLMSVRDIDRLGAAHRMEEGEGEPPSGLDALLADARDFAAQHGALLRIGALLVLGGVARAAASRPDTELIGDWVYARHTGQIRAIAACGLPAAAIMLFAVASLGDEAWWIVAIFAAMALASLWLMLEVFGSTLRFNDDAAEWRRLLRRPRIVKLRDATFEEHPRRPVFTVRDGAGNAIRFNIRYRVGAIPLVNYLARRADPPAVADDDDLGTLVADRVQ
ncbi:hypothetical protein ACFQ09_11630 [Massilia norwichensis]|uniref:Uncharacterized protein n=1 Tax=Massilia norwichensis TaxID=1442366 RepID=A0ABT2A4D0_9BURK|nr:hypothetical protein [Massilia norwichensis]MCS0588942.1 hypothetical protein [Massilia norwichensis]